MAESTVVSCPACGKKYKIAADKLGRTFKCTGCETKFKAGEEPAPVAAPPVVVEPPDEPETDSATSEGGEMAAAPAAVDYSSAGTGKPKASGMAIASLVCGILLCLAPLSSVFALVFGFLGLGKAKKGMGGKGMAITGIVLGVVGILMSAASVAVLLPLWNKSQAYKKHFQVADNMKTIIRSMYRYQSANENHLPPDLATLWKSDPTLNGNLFVSPFTTDTPATTPAQLEAGHDSFKYIYPGPDVTMLSSTDVVLYEKAPEPVLDQYTLLMGDGSVHTCKPSEIAGYITKSTKHPAK